MVSMLELDTNNHSVFLLWFHLVLVIKYRRKVIDNSISNRLKEIFEYINKTLETCRILYNHFLAERKDKYEKEQKRVSYAHQQNSLPSLKETNPNLQNIYSQVLQDVAQRVKKAFQGFFLRLRSKTGKAGYPRFKFLGRYDSFAYSQNNGNYKLEQSQ